ncbi:gastrula zinc finger protein XlCGF57.1-like [Prorops nasuta]|uniref:gastrula zinc finger protein XlCGF57.1-like n=1 Tax=Prorops nasuta TaxID=863751 RepID=UPI0034CED410
MMATAQLHSYPQKTWMCLQCGKRYLWRGSLKNHIRVECGKEPTFKCPVCGRKFKHKHRWQSHAKLAMEKRWICFQCGKRYIWKDSLLKHLRVECGKDPTFECPICENTSTIEKNITSLSTVAFAYVICKDCGTRFFNRSRFLTHIQDCPRDRKFICQICTKQFKRKYNFQRHLRFVHNLEE